MMQLLQKLMPKPQLLRIQRLMMLLLQKLMPKPQLPKLLLNLMEPINPPPLHQKPTTKKLP
jgi:hypothetical protein